MNKIQKYFLYLTGMFMALAFKIPGTFAQLPNVPEILYGPPMDMYGPAPLSNLTWWEKTLAVITSPIILIIIALAVIIGIIILIKRKNEANIKQNE